MAQLGRQLCKVSVPLPSPVLFPHSDHVTPDMDMSPAQPISTVCGRTRGFGPGRHDTTVGTLTAGLKGADTAAVVEWDGTEATEASVTTLPADVEGAGELMANPTAKPTPRAARTAAVAPARRTVLRRIVITCTFRLAEEASVARDLGYLMRRWEWANPEPFTRPALGGVGDLR
jgi:hypothetical protein